MVDIRDQNNKELAMRLVTDIESGDTFYTDLNGFQVKYTRLQTLEVHQAAALFLRVFKIILVLFEQSAWSKSSP